MPFVIYKASQEHFLIFNTCIDEWLQLPVRQHGDRLCIHVSAPTMEHLFALFPHYFHFILPNWILPPNHIKRWLAVAKPHGHGGYIYIPHRWQWRLGVNSVLALSTILLCYLKCMVNKSVPAFRLLKLKLFKM